MKQKLCIAICILLCACTTPDRSGNTDLALTAERFVNGVYVCNPSAVDELAADSIIVSYPIFQQLFQKPAFHGKTEVINFADGFCSRWKDGDFVVEESVVEEDKVVLVWSFSARNIASPDSEGVASNDIQSWGGISVFYFNEDGKIIAEIGEESTPGPAARYLASQ